MIPLSKQHIPYIWTAFILLIAIILLQNTLIVLSSQSSEITGKASADVSLCIAEPPYWLNPITCDTAFSTIPFTCNVSAQYVTRPVELYTIEILAGNASSAGLFNVSTNGTLHFTANESHAGDYTLRLRASENYGTCQSENETSFNLTITAGNQAPVLTNPIPNSTWNYQTILVPYDLDNHFTDPNGDALAYRATGNTQIKIEINGQGQVTLTPATDYCGVELVQFIATDPGNLSATSNVVRLEVKCLAEEEDNTATSSGGGGGGGGSRNQQNYCSESRYCYDWSDCYYTNAVIQDEENPRKLQITGPGLTQTFLIDGDIPSNVSIYYRGYQWRECIDTNQCTLYDEQYVRSCRYEPTCNDRIQNQNEIEVDCGGVCGPCHTCDDGIQNGAEEDIDCGGPDCPQCHTCTDGIINGKELGVDCGGPDCPTCYTCFDGIQNGAEEGIDCGGPTCRACAQEQEPAVTLETAQRGLLAALGVALLLLLFMIFAGRKLAVLIATMVFKYKKRNRIILIDASTRRALIEQLEGIQTDNFGAEALKQQEHLANIVRTYLNLALGTSLEVTSEELEETMLHLQIHVTLQELINSYFITIEEMQFSTSHVEVEMMKLLIAEAEQIITQTSILGTADLALLDARELPETAKEMPAIELITAAHRLLHTNRIHLASTVYTYLHEKFQTLDLVTQERLHPPIRRLYEALHLAEYKQRSLLYKRK